MDGSKQETVPNQPDCEIFKPVRSLAPSHLRYGVNQSLMCWKLQSWAIKYGMGCVNPTSWLFLVAGIIGALEDDAIPLLSLHNQHPFFGIRRESFFMALGLFFEL